MTTPGLATVILIFTVGGASASSPPQSEGTRQSVRMILRAHEFIPLTAAEWMRLGDEVDRHLAEAADDSELTYGARQRAMRGLAVIGGPRARTLLRGMISRSRVAPALLSTAVQEYARAFARSEPAEVGVVTIPLLEHADWVVRQGAVRALGALDSPEGNRALLSRQRRENHAAVRAALRLALRQPRSD
jgi:HEAT repeat protein